MKILNLYNTLTTLSHLNPQNNIAFYFIGNIVQVQYLIHMIIDAHFNDHLCSLYAYHIAFPRMSYGDIYIKKNNHAYIQPTTMFE